MYHGGLGSSRFFGDGGFFHCGRLVREGVAAGHQQAGIQHAARRHLQLFGPAAEKVGPLTDQLEQGGCSVPVLGQPVVHHLLEGPGGFAEGIEAHHAAGALERVETAADGGHRLAVIRGATHDHQIFGDGIQHLGGFHHEDFVQLGLVGRQFHAAVFQHAFGQCGFGGFDRSGLCRGFRSSGNLHSGRSIRCRRSSKHIFGHQACSNRTCGHSPGSSHFCRNHAMHGRRCIFGDTGHPGGWRLRNRFRGSNDIPGNSRFPAGTHFPGNGNRQGCIGCRSIGGRGIRRSLIGRGARTIGGVGQRQPFRYALFRHGFFGHQRQRHVLEQHATGFIEAEAAGTPFGLQQGFDEEAHRTHAIGQPTTASIVQRHAGMHHIIDLADDVAAGRGGIAKFQQREHGGRFQ